MERETSELSLFPREWRFLLLAALGVALLLFAAVALNQIVAFHALLVSVHPMLGRAMLGTLALLMAFLTYQAVYVAVRLPARIRVQPGPGQIVAVRNELMRRIRHSDSPEIATTSKNDSMAELVVLLDGRADALIEEHAGKVFRHTAISQSGALDTLIVLSHQFRLIHRIAVNYYQRPSMRELLELHRFVFLAATAASQLDDIDYMEQLDPVLDVLIGKEFLGGMIPALQGAVHLVVNSVINGSLNAWFTVRLGVIAKRHCRIHLDERFRVAEEEAAIRAISEEIGTLNRSSKPESVALYRGVIARNSPEIVRTIVDTLGRKIKGFTSHVRQATGSWIDGIVGRIKRRGCGAAEGGDRVDETDNESPDSSK